MKRIGTLVMAAFAILILAFGLTPRVRAQDVVQNEGPRQKLTVIYPDNGVVLQGKGDDEVRYKGTIYVKIYAVSPRLKKKLGDGPVYTNELELSAWHTYYTPELPLGEYEVHFSMRDGDNFRTCIVRNVLLTPTGETTVKAELSGTSNTLVIGGTLTMQQLENVVLFLDRRVTALQAEVAALKGGKATPAPVPAPDVPPAAPAPVPAPDVPPAAPETPAK